MKKLLISLLSLVLLVINCYSNEIKIPFDRGIAYIPQINGKDDLSNIRIEYDNGWFFYGRGTEDGFPIEGDYENQELQHFYSGKFDENEKFTGYAELETPTFQYVGEFLNGKVNGFGKLYNKKTNIIYEGTFLQITS